MKSAPGQEKWYTLVCINPILVWNKQNGKMMSRLREHFTNSTLQFLFGNDHYKPILSCMTTSNDHTPKNLAKNINSINIHAFEVQKLN
jgi:hypothetical protein